MKNFQIFRYIKKFAIAIILFSLAAGALFVKYANNSQTYTANAVIRYANYDASSGRTPDGKALDVTEINSAKVMTAVFEELGFDYQKYDFEDIRSRIHISPIVTAEATNVQAALNNQGETYDQKATDYIVTFTASNDEGAEFAQTILNTTIQKYLVYYSEQHVNQQNVTNPTAQIMDSNYDYIEMMEIIDANLTTTKDALLSKFNSNISFRSMETGYTFYDLYTEFNFLDTVKSSEIFAKILDNQITKNKSVLLAKYEKRISEFGLENIQSETEYKDVLDVIDSYVAMMKRSGNTDITQEYILNSVYDTYRDGQWDNIDRTVEYEVLLNNYVNNRSSYEFNIIDAAYNKYIIDVFSGTHGNASYATESDVKADISDLVTRMNELYELADKTNAEYNEYLGAKNILTVASTDVYNGINTKLYIIVAIVLFVILGCLGAILVGRFIDIFDYYMYEDKKIGLPNKSGCERYMDDYRNKYLTMNYSCMAFAVSSQKFSDQLVETKATVEQLKDMADILKDVFLPDDNIFISYYGTGLFLVFAKDTDYDKARYDMDLIEAQVREYNSEHDSAIVYRSSVKESGRDKLFTLRALMNETVGELYPSGSNAEDHDEDEIPSYRGTSFDSAETYAEPDFRAEDFRAEDLHETDFLPEEEEETAGSAFDGFDAETLAAYESDFARIFQKMKEDEEKRKKR